MVTSDLNALLAQVVRAADESRCSCRPDAACQACWKGEGEDWSFIHDADCERCHGSNRPPLAQAVWEGMTTVCIWCKGTKVEYQPVQPYGSEQLDCHVCAGTGRLPLTIPASWPEQWANDAVGGGIEGIPRTVKGEVSLEIDALLVKAYALVLHGNAPGALRALLAAVKGEAGK